MKNREHHMVMVPGLNDQMAVQKWAMNLIPKLWKRFGVIGHIVQPHWEEGSSFRPKLDLILAKIDDLIDRGHKVSILGLSAGGSAALNAFVQRRKELIGAVNGTGRVRAGENVRPSLNWAARNSPAFRESVLLFEEKNEPVLSKKDREKIMTIRPKWDEIVPSSTVEISGADNRIIPVISHLLGGAYVGLVYGGEIVKFLEGGNR